MMAPTCLVQTRPLANSSRPPLNIFGAGLPSSPTADAGQRMVRVWPERQPLSGLRGPGPWSLFVSLRRDESCRPTMNRRRTGFELGVAPELRRGRRGYRPLRHAVHLSSDLSGIVALVGSCRHAVCAACRYHTVSPIVASPLSTADVTAVVRAVASAAAVAASCSSTSGTAIS